MIHTARIGVVGIGFGQHVLVPAFRSLDACRVSAICASNSARAETAAERLGVPRAYGEWRELVADSSVDVVAIATPPELQPAIAILAAQNQKHVFCEKPVATSVDAAARMRAAAVAARVVHAVDFEFPELDAWQRARSIVRSGEIGQVRHVLVTWEVETYASRMGLESWKTRTANGGGVLNSMLSHTLYYLEWLIGPIQSLACMSQPSDNSNGDNATVLSLAFEGGATAAVTASSIAFAGSGHRVEVYATEGSLFLENRTTDYVRGFELYQATRDQPGKTPVPVVDIPSPPIDGRVAAVARVAARFLAAIRAGQMSEPSLDAGLRVQELLHAARMSACSAATVVCKPLTS